MAVTAVAGYCLRCFEENVWESLNATIGVRDGGAGGQLPPQFGQFVDMNTGRESNHSGKTEYMFE